MSKYKFSTKSKVIRVLMYVLISLFVSFVGVSVYLYFNPVDRNIPLENAYFVASDEKYVKLLRNGAVNRSTAKSSDTVTVSNTMMLGLLVDGVGSIDLEYYPIDGSSFENGMSKLSLPKDNKEVDSTLLDKGDGNEYVKLTMFFKKPKTFSGLISTYCNILNIPNCTRKVDLDNWKLEKVNSVNVFNIKDFRNDVLKRGNEWLMKFGGVPMVKHKFEVDGIQMNLYGYSNPSELYSFVNTVLPISGSWKYLKDDAEYMEKTSEYVKSSFQSIDKNYNENITKVSCLKVGKILENIEKCGVQCKNLLEVSFVKEFKDLCLNNNNYESEYTRYKKRMLKNFKEIDSFQNTGLLTSRLTDFIDKSKVNDENTHSLSVLSSTADYMRGFGYWLYNIKNPADKSAVLAQSYTAYIGMLKEMLKEQNYGMCEIGNVALDYYNLSKDEKYLKDAKYIRENGNIVEKNILPTGIDYMSSYYLRESTACADFLVSYYNTTGDTMAYVDSLRILSDRMNRSLEAKGFSGSYFTESYLVDSYDIDKSDKRPLAFRDSVFVDGKRIDIFLTDTLSFILNVITEI